MVVNIETFTQSPAAPSMSLRCRLFGHKVPAWRRFLLTERYQRCERCGNRVLVGKRWR